MATPLGMLTVDDEPAIRRLLRTSLGTQGYRLLEAQNGREALAKVEQDKPDAIVLDLGLPDTDGLDLIPRLRQLTAAPILVLSIRSDERGKVEALDLGSDDYITKPFGIEELLARLRTAFRHCLQQHGSAPVFRHGALTVDLARRVVTLKGKVVKLSPTEYQILHLLVLHAGKVLTHQHILREVWGADSLNNIQYLRVYIRTLRQKIESDPARPCYLVTEPGVGYRLHAGDWAPSSERG